MGDRLECVREVTYDNEGLIIPNGRRATVTKVKLDGREQFAAVKWDFIEGIYAVSRGGDTSMPPKG